RSEDRLVFSAEHARHLGRDATEHQTVGIHDVPGTLDVSWLRGVRGHAGDPLRVLPTRVQGRRRRAGATDDATGRAAATASGGVVPSGGGPEDGGRGVF